MNNRLGPLREVRDDAKICLVCLFEKTKQINILTETRARINNRNTRTHTLEE